MHRQDESNPPTKAQEATLLTEKSDYVALCEAVVVGDITQVRVLLGKDANLLNVEDQTHLTPITLAAHNRKWEIVKEIAKIGGVADDVMDQRQFGRALLRAVRDNQVDVVEILANITKSVNRFWMTAPDSWTALHHAAAAGNTEMIALLVSAGFSLTAVDKDGCTPIAVAAHNEQWAAVIGIAKVSGAARDDNDEHQYGRALINAVRKNQLDVVEILIQARKKAGTSKEWHTNPDLWRALHHAAAAGNTEMIALLVSAGFSLTAVDKDYFTPIAIAAFRRNWTAVVEIASLHQVEAADAEKYSVALVIAAQYKQYEVVKALRAAGAPTGISWDILRSIGRAYQPGKWSWARSDAHPHHAVIAEFMKRGVLEAMLKDLGVKDACEALELIYQVLDNDKTIVAKEIITFFEQRGRGLVAQTKLEAAQINRIPYLQTHTPDQAELKAFFEKNLQLLRASTKEQRALEVEKTAEQQVVAQAVEQAPLPSNTAAPFLEQQEPKSRGGKIAEWEDNKKIAAARLAHAIEDEEIFDL